MGERASAAAFSRKKPAAEVQSTEEDAVNPRVITEKERNSHRQENLEIETPGLVSGPYKRVCKGKLRKITRGPLV